MRNAALGKKATLDGIENAAQLTEFLQPRLEAIDGDANLQGTVLRRLDPLLKSLPKTVVLTGKTVDSFGLNEHEAAYLLFESWRRACPDIFNAALATSQSIADAFVAAAEAGGKTFGYEPSWLLAERDYISRTGGRPSSISVEGALSDPQISFEEDIIKLKMETAEYVYEFNFDKTPKGGWGVTSASQEREPIKDLPSLYLLELRRALNTFTPAGVKGFFAKLRENAGSDDPDARNVAALVRAIDAVLTEREAAVGDHVQKALDRFRDGNADGIAGELPKSAVAKVARQRVASK
jgi:hypothetical protein